MKKFLPLFKIIACGLLCLIFIIIFACFPKKRNDRAMQESTFLNVWQIDSFEGGKGSRADYLQKIGANFSKKEKCYVNVTSISAESARVNLANGVTPDIISYGPTAFGFESYIENSKVWCHGSYCLLTLDSDADFSDVNKDNTVINEGKDNFVFAAALLCGLQGAQAEKPTGAYVKLIDGKYKYLLGTHRDVFRLKTREVGFAVKAISVFNDLYQLISTTKEGKNKVYAEKFVNYALAEKDGLTKIGMLYEGAKLYDSEMSALEGVNYDYKLSSPINREKIEEINSAISVNDINKLKNLFN